MPGKTPLVPDQLDGVTLDNFAELKTVEGLKEGSLIKVRLL